MRRSALSLALLLGGVAAAVGLLLLLVGSAPAPHEGPGARPAGLPSSGPAAGGPAEVAPPPAEPSGEVAPFDGPRKLAVAGTVRAAEDGPPLAGALLRALRVESRKVDNELLAETRSDAEGRYVLGPVEGRILVEAGAEGRARERRWAQAGDTVDFALGSPGTLAGKIAYEGDRPCADAVVRVHSSQGVPAGDLRTDGGGAYRFPDLAPGTYSLEALPPEDPSVRVRDIEVRAGEETVRDLVVARGVQLRGRVADAETDQPIAGAEIEITSNQRLRGTSDEEGRYEVRGFGPERTRVVFRARGYLASTPWVQPDAEMRDVTYDVKLRRGGTVRGVVLGPAGDAVPGAQAGINPWAFQQPGSDGVASTDEQGIFVLEGVPPGQHAVFAVAEGYAPGRSLVPVEVRSGEESPGVEIRLTLGGTIAGRVRSEKGEGIEGASVQVWPTSRGGMGAPVVGRQQPQRTDAEGAYEADHLAAGTYLVRVEKEGYAAEVRQNLDVADGGRTEGVDFTLLSGSFIAGRVVDGDGKPLAGVTVTAYPRQISGGMMWQQFRAETGADGTFRLQGLRDGTWQIHAVKAGFGSAVAGDVASGTDGLAVRIVEQGAVLVEAVLASTGQSAPSYRLLVYGTSAEMPRGWPMRSENVQDAKGQYALKGLNPGSYVLEASTGAGLLSERTRVDVVEGGEPVSVRLVIEAGAALRGVVQTPHGEPASQARVMALPQGGESVAPIQATTDGEGRFLLRPLAPGTYEVRASHGDWIDAREILSVQRGVETTVSLTLRVGGSLRTIVADGDGTPVPGANVQLRASNGQSQGIDFGKLRKGYEELRRADPFFDWGAFIRRIMTTDAAGVNHRTDLPPDRYTVQVAASGFAPGTAEADVADGRETTVRVTLKATDAVPDPAAGKVDPAGGPGGPGR